MYNKIILFLCYFCCYYKTNQKILYINTFQIIKLAAILIPINNNNNKINNWSNFNVQ